MSNLKRCFFSGCFVACVLNFTPLFAFHEPGHIPPTGTCREPSCLEPPRDGQKDKNKPKDEPCDDKKLKELKAKRDAKIKAYKEIVAAAEDTKQREAEAIKEAQDIFGKYTKDLATKGATTVGKELFPVPSEVYEKFKKYKKMTTEPSSTEEMLELAKFYVEELAKEAGYKTATERAKWVNAAMSGALMDAMVLSKLKEAETLAEAAYNQWLLAYENLTDARHLEEQIRKLEAQCKAKGGKGGSSPSEEADSRSSGEREAEQAQKLLDGWKKVEGGFEDSEGNFHDADMAFEEAMSIVQSQESSQLHGYTSLVSFTLMAAEMTDAQMQAEWTRYREPLRRAFELVIRAMQTYHRAEKEFYLIVGNPAASGKPATSGSSKGVTRDR
jgi:hypothetical protein